MVPITDSFSYLPEYNIVINNEFKPIFLKYAAQKRVDVLDSHPQKETIQNRVKNLEQICFSITYNCNLQCKYCIYSGEYPLERTKTTLKLSYKIAVKGLKYIHTLIGKRPNRNLSISFYGGEPTLAFSTIQKIVGFANSLFEAWKISYSITTNGTLLKKEQIDFLIDNHFTILISLDGPRHSHDSKRRYPGGDGSFDSIWDNIKKLKKINEKYFREKVYFSIIYSNDLSLLDVFLFFSENPLINKNGTKFGLVNPYKTGYYEKYPKHPDYEKHSRTIQKHIKEKLEEKGKLEYSIEKNVADLNIIQLSNKSFSTLAGSCDFSRKLFIDPTGTFHICEKINEKFPTGNVWDGFNFSRMEEIADQFTSIIKDNCIKCQWKFLCTPCYIHFADDGKFKFDKKFCDTQKKLLPRQLENFVEQNSVRNSKTGCKSNLKFHQFVVLEQGPINTAILDFLKGDVFQVDNKTIEDFQRGYYDRIPEFIKSAEKEDLFIHTSPGTWIPPLNQGNDYLSILKMKANRMPLTLEIDDGANLEKTWRFFKNCDIGSVKYYGHEKIDSFFPNVSIEYCEKDFSRCLSMSKINGDFPRISEDMYYLQKKFNSCWGFKVAISKNLEVKPCIYSEIVIGHLGKESISTLITKLEYYWELSKDKIDTCKDCELKYICFDCREIAYRKDGNLFGPNPNCNYNPYTGEWKEPKNFIPSE